jgi:glutamine phosphoribosylpyrophosphate amidotransferase
VCGIAGIISRDDPNLGNELIDMLKELIHRGKDATGLAIYEKRDDVQIRVALTSMSFKDELETIIKKYGRIKDSRIYQGEGVFSFYEATLEGIDDSKIKALNWDVDSHPELCVHSLGRHIKVYKDQGSAENLHARHAIPSVVSTHGIGHVRLATESVENINFAHPFVSYIDPELAIVHNGQFTNYFNTRRRLQNLGIRFKTNNDSEMAAHFIAYHMKEKGMDLEETLYLALDEFDGVFTLLVSTPDQVGALRDRLGIKPMLSFRKDDSTVLLGSEQICLTPIVSDVYATEMEPGGVMTWSV